MKSAIKLDAFPSVSKGRTVVLTGQNDSDIATIQVAGVAASVVQSTKTTWRAEIRLTIGINRIEINGLDVAGNTSESIVILIELRSLSQRQHRAFNVFDEFGLLLALPRLPGEKNQFYKNRLADVNAHPSDTTQRGVTFGSSREIGLRITKALSISSPLDGDLLTTRAIDGAIKVGQVYVDVTSTRLRTRECLVIEPATQRISLVDVPRLPSEIMITTLEGDVIDNTQWEYDSDNNEVKFLSHELNGLPVYASFPYKVRVDIRTINLSDLKTAIEAITDPNGLAFFDVTILADPTLPAANLIPTPRPLFMDSLSTVFEQSPLRVKELHDHDFQVSQLNDRNHAIGTKLEAWANKINNQTRIIWDATFLGESIWEPLGSKPRLGALPHNMDAERGHWECGDPSDTTRFTLKDFRDNNGRCPTDGSPLEYRGIRPLEFQSGTGTRDDLKVRDITVLRGD